MLIEFYYGEMLQIQLLILLLFLLLRFPSNPSLFVVNLQDLFKTCSFDCFGNLFSGVFRKIFQFLETIEAIHSEYLSLSPLKMTNT